LNGSQRPKRGVEVYLYSFLNFCARCGSVFNATPRPLYSRERPVTHCIGGWVDPRTGLDGCGKYRPHRDSNPDRPTRSESLYRLSYPRPFSGPRPGANKVEMCGRIRGRNTSYRCYENDCKWCGITFGNCCCRNGCAKNTPVAQRL
jgi:hypothetical protein